MRSLHEILALVDVYERDLPRPPLSLTPPGGVEIAAWIDHTLLRPEGPGLTLRRLH